MSLPSTPIRVAGLLTVAIATVPAATASAAVTTTHLSDKVATGIADDGRYVIFSDSSILDRINGKPRTLGGDTLIALSPTSEFTLLKDATGRISDLSLVNGSNLPLNLGTDTNGNPVPIRRAFLVNGGATVIFQTQGANAPITEFDVATQTPTVRLSGPVQLDGASEDGKVITWSKALPAETRPAGTVPPGHADTASVAGHAVGYQVKGDVPHVVATTTFDQRLGGPNGGIPCSQQYGIADIVDPTGLEVAQDGAAGGRYTLLLSAYNTYGIYPQDSGVSTKRLTLTGSDLIAGGGYTVRSVQTQDPISAANALVVTSHGSAPSSNSASVTAEDGTTLGISYPLTDTSTDPAGFTDRVFPFARGAGAVFTGNSRSNEQAGTFVALGDPVGASTFDQWLTLPRAIDPVLSGAERTQTKWASCVEPPAPSPADYAPITLKTTGNSAGTVGVVLRPAGATVPATSVTATVSWFGLRLWSRTATTSTPMALPAIPAGVPGFKVTVKITLADGRVVTESAALRRTR